MKGYIIRRLLLMIPTLLGISLILFTLIQFLPGGPIEHYISHIRSSLSASGISNIREVTEAEIESLRRNFGYDKPAYVRYFHWLGNLLQGDLGESFSYQEPVWDVILQRIPISLFLGLSSFFLSYMICIPLALKKALRHGTNYDFITSALIFAGYIIPGYVLALLLIIFFSGGSFLDIFPIGGAVSDNFEELSIFGQAADFLHHMFLPLMAYMASEFAFLTMLLKNSLLEEASKNYMLTAVAKGASYKQAMRRHALRNSLIPLATRLSEVFTLIFTSALLIEKVFNIDGMGLLVYNSMLDRDYNVVLGIILLASFLSMLGRLFSDVLYVVIDPRIRYD